MLLTSLTSMTNWFKAGDIRSTTKLYGSTVGSAPIQRILSIAIGQRRSVVVSTLVYLLSRPKRSRSIVPLFGLTFTL